MTLLYGKSPYSNRDPSQAHSLKRARTHTLSPIQMAANQRDIDTILLMMDDLCTVLNDRHHTLVAAITDQIQHDLS